MSTSAGKPLVIAAIGARGTGKSAWVKQQLEQSRPARLLVWDPMREYSAFPGAQVFYDLGGAIRVMAAPRWTIVYQPPAMTDMDRQFELLCMAVKEAKRCVFLVEELAFVTMPRKAPPAWRELCLLGRHPTHAESTIIGTSQRPASIDKDFVSCCDVIHCGRLGYKGDAEAVAPYLGCHFADLQQLADLDFIEKVPGEAQPIRGTLTFGHKPALLQKKVSPAKSAPKDQTLRTPIRRNRKAEPR